MSAQQPPPRLLDDPQLGRRVRDDLSTARATPSLDYDATAGWARFSANLSPPTPDSAPQVSSPAGNHGASLLRSGQALKWWALSALGLGVVAAVVLFDATSHVHDTGGAESAGAPAVPRVDPPRSPKSPEPSTPAPAPEAEEAERSANKQGEEPTEAEQRQHGGTLATPPAATRAEPRSASRRRRARATPTRADSPAPDADARKLREIRQLAAARRALSRAPASALELARAGQREFADGIFVEERAALIVFSLEAMGERDRAQRSGREFLRRYPAGPFSARVQAIVESSR